MSVAYNGVSKSGLTVEQENFENGALFFTHHSGPVHGSLCIFSADLELSLYYLIPSKSNVGIKQLN